MYTFNEGSILAEFQESRRTPVSPSGPGRKMQQACTHTYILAAGNSAEMKAFFAPKFDPNALRLSLKVGNTRIEMTKNRKANEIAKQKIEISRLLVDNANEELARIRTEHLIRDDWYVETLSIVGLMCALVQERVKLIEASESIPFDMRETLATLIYVADRVDIAELADVKKQLVRKFGKPLEQLLDDPKSNVNERVYARLQAKPPVAMIVLSYMIAIAKENDVEWAPSEATSAAGARLDAPMMAPNGTTILSGAASGIRAPYYVTDGSILEAGQTVPRPGHVEIGTVAPVAVDVGGKPAPRIFGAPPAAGGDSASAPASGGKGASSGGNIFETSPEASKTAKQDSKTSGGGGGGPALPAGSSGPAAGDPDSVIPTMEELDERFRRLQGS